MTQKIERLMSLAQKCYETFAVAQNDSTLRPYLIKGTLPILYFGDIEAYFKSQSTIFLLHLVRHIMKMRQIWRFTRIFYRHLLHCF